MEEMNIREFVKIKSDRLNYEDFIMGPQDFTIARLGRKTDQGNVRLLMFFAGCEETPYWVPKGMVKCLSNPDGWGEDPFSEWIGRRVRLFGEPTVVYAGKELGGIRISAISDINRAYSTKITERRGVRIDYVISPLFDVIYPAALFTEKLPAMRGAIQSGKMTAEQVISHAEKTGKLTDEQKAAISAPFNDEDSQ
jgi:hypothetical protein